MHKQQNCRSDILNSIKLRDMQTAKKSKNGQKKGEVLRKSIRTYTRRPAVRRVSLMVTEF